ncbi:MAG: type IV toxin-antitoxin system AbiEi family antitoxin domain-containing protein [Candidatus Sumerlaeia bacterium]|nr:type IV toxin-antitoxin system AbiEi family antitoxin domain-containing protein [Candidatus Sumerlaeia bacterium]
MSPNLPSPHSAILQLATERAVFRASEVPRAGNARRALASLVAEGRLIRLGRGLYAAAGADFDAKVTLAEAAARLPGGVICLLSALRFHELTTQNPPHVWMAIGHKRPIRVDYPPVRVIRMSGHSFREGVEEHLVGGVGVRVFSATKTIVDCFKFRRTVGLDVALDALREGWQRRAFSMDELWHFAGTCRVRNLIRPYLEML